jgi:hypothetical protein
MADRRGNQKSREAESRLANEWLVCAKHGGYSPNMRGRHGWVRRNCPGCDRERYEGEAADPRTGLRPIA